MDGSANNGKCDVSGSVVNSFSIDLHRGEVIGLTGLLGMGQEQVPHLLFGSQRARSGEVTLYTISGGKHAWPGGPPPTRIGADQPTPKPDASRVMSDFA